MKYILYCYLLVLVLLAVGCKDDSNDILIPDSIEIFTGNISLDNIQASSGTIELNSNVPWTLKLVDENESLVSWLSVEPTEGKAGKSTLVVTAKEQNMQLADRIAFIQVIAGAETKTVKLVQKRERGIAASMRCDVPSDGGHFYVELSGSETYTIHIPEESRGWISYLPSASTATAETFFAMRGDLSVCREGMIIFQTIERSDTVRVFQDPYAGVVLESNQVTLSGSREVFEVALLSHVGYNAAVTQLEGGWLRLATSSLAANENKVTFEVDENLTGGCRAATVVFSSHSSAVGNDTLTVTQASKSVSAFDGKVLKLQQATKGSGIDMVFLGDGYLEEDLADGGAYEQVMYNAMEHFFSVEPVKSHRQYFNVYVVKAVSETSRFDTANSTTAFGVEFREAGSVTGNDKKCIEYALKAPVSNIFSTLIAVVVNDTRWAGTSHLYFNSSFSVSLSISYISMAKQAGDAGFAAIVHHELIGHSLGKLCDEYVSYNETIATEKRKAITAQYQSYGWYANVDFTGNRDRVSWKNFIGHPAYPYVYVYEGAAGYSRGIWRPEEASCMSDNRPYFNAPSREEIVKRIMWLADEPYSWDYFVSVDKYEPVAQLTALRMKLPMLAPPTITKGIPK